VFDVDGEWRLLKWSFTGIVWFKRETVWSDGPIVDF
jgi:hypothetical protein